MAKIHSIKVSNFRGIKSYIQNYYGQDFICIVGRGDSGKTTLLDSISYALSPNWNVTFYDTDFYNCNIEEPMVIEVSLYDLPSELIREDKYGLHVKFLNNQTGQIQDEYIDNSIAILTIRLKVERDLEPCWFVVNCKDEEKEIRATDRAKLNTFLIADFVNQHFSWNKGTPLYSLLKQENGENENNSLIIDALRDAKEKIDETGFNHLSPTETRIKDISNVFGINLTDIATSIDLKDITIRDGRVCLHENKVPFRLKGKGSKRLLSIAIQMALAKSGGITLIDEIEQGLEPDRVKHLVRTLYCENKRNNGQVFITSHSQNVIEELDCDNLLLLKNMNGDVQGSFVPVGDKYQSLIRTCQSSIYARKVIVCEGKTEIGLCRAFDNYRIQNGLNSFSSNDVVFVDGAGASFTDRAVRLKELGLDVSVLCDSDRDETLNPEKATLEAKGIAIFCWEAGKSIEKQCFDDLTWNGVLDIIDYRIKNNFKDDIALIQSYLGANLPENWREQDSAEKRNAFFSASTHKVQKANEKVEDKSWFKRIDHGEELGNIILKYVAENPQRYLFSTLNSLSNWIDHNEY
jgi:putative ATP-dependent endonuclease of OLD family